VTRVLAFLVTYPLAGALFAGGALLVLRKYGPDQVKPLGRAGGESFAEGMAAYNALKDQVHSALPVG
jgi:hypothetical protein